MATVVSKQNPKSLLYLTLLPNRLSIKALLGLVKMQSDRASDSLCSPDYVVARVGRLKVQAGYDSAIQRPLPQAPQRFM